VASRLDDSVLGAHSHLLPRGPRVRLRLAQIRDARAIRAFLGEHGFDPDGLEANRLVRVDPRLRVTICATALIGSTETVIGVGAIEVGASEPDVLVVDEALTDGLDALLRRALRGRAAAIADRRAA
jgi:hypothetical protein